MMSERLLDELGGDHVEVDGVCAGMDAVALQNLGDGISSHCDPPQDGVRYRFLDALERCGGCRAALDMRVHVKVRRENVLPCIEVLVPHLRGGSCVVFGKGHAVIRRAVGFQPSVRLGAACGPLRVHGNDDGECRCGLRG